MADLMFKRGLYSNLHNVAVTDGAVYFTTDTNELYFDDANGRHRMQDVITVATYSELNSKYPLAADKAALTGRLVYITDTNILMTYNGTNWVQVNAQKTLVELLGTAAFSVGVNSGIATITHTIGNNADADENLEANFQIATATPNTVTLSSSGKSLIVNVKETEERAEITAEASTNGAKIVVTNERDVLNAQGTATETAVRTNTNVEVVGEGTVAKVGVNDNGQITIDADFEAKLSTENGAIKLAVEKDGAAVSASTSVAPAIKLQNATSATTFVSSGNTLTATLPVYSITEVDEKVKTVSDKVDTTAGELREEISTQLASANAMTFRGTVGTNATVTSLPMTTAQIGDTYKVVTGGYYVTDNAGTEAEASEGDLFIATSTTGKENSTLADGTTPVISKSEVSWVHVPAGDDANFELYVTNGIINLGASATDHTNGTIHQGTAISITNEGSQKAIINHADVEHAETTDTAVVADAKTAKTITAVTGVTVNDQGHVTGIETTDVTLTQFGPTSSIQTVTASANKAIIQSSQHYVSYNEAGEQNDLVVSPIALTVNTDNLVMVNGGDNKSFSINHPEYNPATTDSGKVDSIGDLTVVSAITTNKEGHVTAISTSGLSNAAIAPTAVASTIIAAKNNNLYTATITATDTYGTGDDAVAKSSQYAIASSTIAIEQAGGNNAITMNLVWGSF